MQLDGRECTQCRAWQPQPEFSWKGPDHKRLAARCHGCRRANHKENPERARERARAYGVANRDVVRAQMRARRLADPATVLWRDARKRAIERGLPFDLAPRDVVVPTHCPVLGIELRINEGTCGFDSPTLDRRIPALGYVKGNVAVISHRANTIKSDASLAEILAVARYLRPA